MASNLLRSLVLLAPMLVAAMPPPPSVIAPYVRDGRFEPGDYGWLKGSFAGADALDAAAYRSMLDWRRRCRADDMAETRAELAGLGVGTGASLDTIPYRSLVCDQVATLPEPLDLSDWSAFANDVAVVRPIVQGFLSAVAMAERNALGGSPELRDALNSRTAGEQMLRAGMSWANGGSIPEVQALTLTPQQRGIIVAELAIALAARDHANTAWLKGIVTTQGWPRRSQVGEGAARRAWLLVQHADADPAFQVVSLRLMEPLVSTGEVDRRNYAYLYDRVMLKLTGRQRYATQLTCRNGRFVPQPLENAGMVDGRRRAVGLGTVAENEARVRKEAGSCSDGPALK